VETFDDLPLKYDLLKGIYGMGYENPSPIQQKAILPLINNMDTIAQAQSGTGKTATFTIGLLQNIDTNEDYLQGIILAPTRELAKQNAQAVQYLGSYLKVKAGAFIGGTKKFEDKKIISKGLQIASGTPGRLIQLIKEKILNLSYLKMLILDEADEMLDRGFIESIREIIGYIPETTQICLFSATMPKAILEISDKFMNNPAKVLVKKEKITLEGIRQFYIPLKREWKGEVLLNLYKTLEIHQAIIFCNSKKTVNSVKENLELNGFIVSCIHSELEQDDRDRIMKEFRLGASRVLVSTDLLARGIDVSNVNIVINYDLTTNKETYIHRVGRSGRFGRKGIAISFINSDEMDELKDIMKYYNTIIEELPKNITEL